MEYLKIQITGGRKVVEKLADEMMRNIKYRISYVGNVRKVGKTERFRKIIHLEK